jgi:acyl-CoA reductase-like NAD-dependent aldehyde dehydrogenase
MLRSSYPYYLANRKVHANTDLTVYNKFSGQPVTRVALADERAIDQAIGAAAAAAAPMRKLPAFERQSILQHCVARFRARAEELAVTLCIEAGKPIRDSRTEVQRLIETFTFAAEESTRCYGEVIPLDVALRGQGSLGMWKRVPVGPCSFISPFNFPLNLAAHKIAPAIAAGCPFVLKPASSTPVSALLIGEILSETALPDGAFSILPCARDGARLFTEDERLRLLSFTGSPDVGWALKARAGKKKVVLELGGNAACIVDETADLDDAAERIVLGAFFQSGQSCISVQRVIAHASIYVPLREKLLARTRQLVVGDPTDEATNIGPLISEAEAARVQAWLEAALAAGARLLCGGQRRGPLMDPVWVEDVPRGAALREQEVFGPVGVLSAFTDFSAALAEVNDSRFGLQAGVFTRDIYRAHQAWDELEVGGVMIGDVPSFRIDNMPYGGVKDSGLGREGVRFAIADMTEPRLMVVRPPPHKAG